jgi:predicted ferric reductase
MRKGLIIAVAILLPVVPLVAWLADSWQQFSEPLGAAFYILYVPARAFGLIGFVLMFYQFVLASRVGILEAVFPRAKQLKTHRTLGKIGGVLMLTHGGFMLLFDLVSLGAITFTLEKLLGIVGLFLVLNAVIAAWFIRPLQLTQPTWRRIHRVAYVVFPTIFLHAILIGNTVRGYAAVRWMFIAFLAVYAALVVRRIVQGPPGAKRRAKA